MYLYKGNLYTSNCVSTGGLRGGLWGFYKFFSYFLFPVFSIGLTCYSENGYLIPPKVSYEEDEEEGLQE